MTKSKIKALLGGFLVVATSIAVGAGSAEAAGGNVDLANGCKITWSNVFNGVVAQGRTQERADCASLLTRIAYYNPSGGYTEASTGYVPSSDVAIARSAAGAVWSDHYGRRTSSGTAYGVRRYF